MVCQKVQQFSACNPSSLKNIDQSSSRSFVVQAKQSSDRSFIQKDMGNDAFNQKKFEAFELQLKEKHGTITPVEQKKLGVLQAKMDNILVQHMEQAKTLPNLLEILTRNSPKVEIAESQTSIQSKIIQAKNNLTGDRPSSPPAQRPNKTGMPGALKAGVESLSGYALDDVRVHYNSSKPAQLQALAYTQGSDIHVASGQEKHLPHEAWHVVQQMQGRVQPTMQMKSGVPVNDDVRLEQEADIMGAKAMQYAGAVEKQSTKPNSVFPQGNVMQRLAVKYGDSDPIPQDAQEIADGQNFIRGRDVGVQTIPEVVPEPVQHAMAGGEQIYIVAHGRAPLGNEPAILQDGNGNTLSGSDIAGFIANLRTGLAAKSKAIGPVKIEACMSSLSRKTKRGFRGDSFVKAKPSLVQDVMTSLANTYKVDYVSIQGNKGFASGSDFGKTGVTNLSPKNTEIGLLTAILDILYDIPKNNWNTKANKSLRNDGINITKKHTKSLANFDNISPHNSTGFKSTAAFIEFYLTANTKPTDSNTKNKLDTVVRLLGSYVRKNLE